MGAMEIREKLNQNQHFAVIACVVIIAVAVIYMFMSGGGGGTAGAGDAYYYDVVTKEYFTDSATLHAPIKSPDGNEAVRAHFFTCTKGDCSEGTRFAAYYEKFTEEAKAKMEAAGDNPEAEFEMEFDGAGVLVSVDAVNWLDANDAEAQEMISERLACKGGDLKRGRYCRVK